MFDNVYDDKLWKKNRDATGLKGSLTEKVSMGDEFKRFQQKKNAAAAQVLLQKITLYEKQLKEKHSKEKYYAKLLKVVQDQKTAIEAGIQDAEQRDKDAEQPRDAEGNKVDMDALVDEVIAGEKKHAQQYENTTNDPSAPAFPGEARRLYLKLTKEFKTVEGKMKAERVAVTDLLQKCKTLETNPNLKAKPENVVIVAKKISEAIEKISTKAMDLHLDFRADAQVVRKEEGRPTGATKELDKLEARLKEGADEIDHTNQACRASLKATLQSLTNNPQAEELMRRLFG